MATVTGIEKVGKLYRISLDERFFCAVDQLSFDKLPLTPGQEIDGPSYLDRVCAHQQKAAYEQALSLLDLCDRTEKQVVDRLTRRGFLPGAAQAAADRLKEMGLIDDAAFASRMVDRGQAVGKYALKRKLIQKGVDRDQADQALTALTDAGQAAACLAAAQKLCRRYRGEDGRAARRKLSQALARRGFSWDDITSSVDKVLTQEE